MWCHSECEAAKLDGLLSIVQAHMRGCGFEVKHGMDELHTLPKASEFHYDITSKSKLVDAWLVWIESNLSSSPIGAINTCSASSSQASITSPPRMKTEQVNMCSTPSGLHEELCSTNTAPWIFEGKCWICSTLGKEADEHHLGSKKHLDRQTHPWDYVLERPTIPTAVVKACQALDPNQQQPDDIAPASEAFTDGMSAVSEAPDESVDLCAECLHAEPQLFGGRGNWSSDRYCAPCWSAWQWDK